MSRLPMLLKPYFRSNSCSLTSCSVFPFFDLLRLAHSSYASSFLQRSASLYECSESEL
jgi:hypothetical protein